jgi:hypothetical protein
LWQDIDDQSCCLKSWRFCCWTIEPSKSICHLHQITSSSYHAFSLSSSSKAIDMCLSNYSS